MPSIPRYGQTQVRDEVAKGEYNIKPSEEAFGGGKALAGIEASGQLAQQVMKVKDDLDQVAAIDAVNRLKQEKTRMMFDPKEGALARRGKDSFDVIETYGTKYKEIGSKLETELKNDNQRKYFKKYFDQEGLELETTLSRHVFQEAEKYDDAQTEALLDNYKNDALLNYADTNAIRQSMVGIEEEVLRHASRKGMPAEWVKQKVQSAHSKVHTGVVAAYITNDQDQLAKAYFESNKDDFTATDRDAVLKDLEQATLRGEGQRRSDSIFDKHQDSMTKAMAEARKIKDPKLRDETERRLEARFTQKNRAEEQDVERMMVDGLNQIDSTGTVAFEKIPGWQKMKSSQRTALMNYAKTKAKGENVSTDWKEYHDLWLMASNPVTRSQFLRTSIYEKRDKLANQEFKELIKKQADLRSGKGDAEESLDQIFTRSQIVSKNLSAIGLKSGTRDDEKIAMFNAKAEAKLRDYLKANGKARISNEEFQAKVVDPLIEEISVVPSSGWRSWLKMGETKRGFEIEAPEDMQEQLAEKLRDRGIEPTKGNIDRAYQLALKERQKKKNQPTVSEDQSYQNALKLQLEKDMKSGR